MLERKKRTDKVELTFAEFCGLDEGYILQSGFSRVLPRVLEDRRRDIAANYARRASRQRDRETAGTASEVERGCQRNVVAEH